MAGAAMGRCQLTGTVENFLSRQNLPITDPATVGHPVDYHLKSHQNTFKYNILC